MDLKQIVRYLNRKRINISLACSRRSDGVQRAKNWGHKKQGETQYSSLFPLVLPVYDLTRSPPSERLEQANTSRTIK